MTRATLCELQVGIESVCDAAAEERRLAPVLESVGVLELTAEGASWYGKIGATLRRRGEHVGDMDVLIAAIAAAHGQTIVTGNARHFSRISELSVIEY